MVYADYWEEYLKPIPESERKDLVTAYYKRLTSPDAKIRSEACRAWSGWEGRAIKLLPDPATIDTFDSDFFAESLARIECHYFVNKSFFETENWLLENCHRIKDIPGYIIHGRYDMCTPFKNAWDLHKVWPKGKLIVVPDAGHAASEPGITDALLTATDELRNL
jgi:proline iminopeptidase